MDVISDRVVSSRENLDRTTVADTRFERCDFESCVYSVTLDPRMRSTLDRLNFEDCSVRGCDIGTAVVRDVIVENLNTHGLFQTFGAVFDRVTLRGRIGRMMLSPVVAPGVASRDEQLAFEEANRAFYAEVDWALDIRDADVLELDLRGVPGGLVRRDPETQVLVTRDAALEGGWRHLPLEATYWPVALDNLVLEGTDAAVLVAPRRARDFDVLLDGLNMLRDAGIAT